MSRLSNPGVGDLCDRLSVLALKILHAGLANQPVDHWVQERNVLLTQIKGRTLNGAWFEFHLELSATNSALWHLDDELRGYRQDWEGDIVSKERLQEHATRCAFRIQALNDRRAGLVHQISELAGDGRGPEKGRLVTEKGEKALKPGKPEKGLTREELEHNNA